MITKPKGTHDLYGVNGIIFERVNDIIKDYMKIYNIEYIRTPIFEASELFHRTVGETSDIVSKETYDFKDRGNRNITLRPEGTAGVTRALIENKLYGNRHDVLKYYYQGTMYRYENPQLGRYREFTQFGIEFYNANNAFVDAEVISIGYNLLQELGLENVTVNINTLGDNETHLNYKKVLQEYLKPHIKKLCVDCQNRYEKNSLRIIDCKIDAENEIIKNSPKIKDYLSNESKSNFNKIKDLLNILEINFTINEKIVRGLDYYTGIVFEYIDEDGVVLGGGGRYNNLVENLGGPNIPGVGFALGLERIVHKIKEKIDNSNLGIFIDVYILAINEEEKYHALKISQNLRLNGMIVETNFNDLSLKSQFKIADNLNAGYLIIMNEEDLKLGIINLKNNATKENIKIDENELIDYLIQNI